MNINLMAPINERSYGITARNVLKSLSKDNVVSLFPIGNVSGYTEDEVQVLQWAIEQAKTYDYEAPLIKIWHQFDLHNVVNAGKTIGWPIFELDAFTKAEIHSMNSTDMLFVCSEWAKQICDNWLNVPARVVPLGVDTSIYRPTSQKLFDNFTIINVGKIEVRKGHSILPEILNKAFPDGNENYMLEVSWNNPFLKPEEVVEWENWYKSTIKNVHFNEWVSETDMVDFMSSANVMLAPSRAEGWNLGLLEAMACGTNIIATNYSGHTEFCNSENSDLINIDGLESAEDGVWFHGAGNWSIPSIKHAAELLRARYDEWKSGTISFNGAGVETAEKFSWDNTARKIIEALS